MKAVPKGIKLKRESESEASRMTYFLGRRGDTVVRKALKGWGVDPDHVDEFAEDLWRFLTQEIQILTPVTLKGEKGRALPGCHGAYQIDADNLRLIDNRGYYQCNKCRRMFTRLSPHNRCMAFRCDGTLTAAVENPDDYNLALLDGHFSMVRPREHSAQVPSEEREIIERAFKGTGDLVNTLVCTPTLELGVDIGALDTILMRNVPPLPANYWQRVGRAGRRHRMAVNLIYCRPASHDKMYFTEPLKMLEGLVEPPRFNMRNEKMVTKHLHAAAITRMH